MKIIAPWVDFMDPAALMGLCFTIETRQAKEPLFFLAILWEVPTTPWLGLPYGIRPQGVVPSRSIVPKWGSFFAAG